MGVAVSIHGGDPRKSKFTEEGSLIENVKGKPRQRVSGASELRSKKDLPNEKGEWKD